MTDRKFERVREFDLDPFRAIVCLWLMGLHFCWVPEVQAALLRKTPDAIGDVAFQYRLGVESFLLLAGFMMAHMLRPVPGQNVRLGAYFARRCYRLLLPFWIAVLLSATDKWAVHLLFDGGNDRPDLGAILSQLLLINEFFGIPEAAVGYWSMATLEQFYLLWLVVFAFVRWITTKGAGLSYCHALSRMGVVTFVVFLASGTAFLCLTPEYIQLPRFAFYIALGILLYGNVRMGVYRWELRIAVAAMVVAAIWLLHSRLTAALVTSAVLYALVREARFPGGRVFDALRFVGRRAYSLYLMHAIIGVRFLSGYRFVADFSDWLAFPFLFVACGLSLIGGVVFYRLIEQPCHALAQRVQYRSSTSDACHEGSLVRGTAL